jgi:hypothetical protein
MVEAAIEDPPRRESETAVSRARGYEKYAHEVKTSDEATTRSTTMGKNASTL